MEETRYGITIPESTVRHQSVRSWEREMVQSRPTTDKPQSTN